MTFGYRARRWNRDKTQQPLSCMLSRIGKTCSEDRISPYPVGMKWQARSAADHHNKHIHAFFLGNAGQAGLFSEAHPWRCVMRKMSAVLLSSVFLTALLCVVSVAPAFAYGGPSEALPVLGQ